jgi:alkylation response protein AidB-like acyl-CoA dehydrogenase
VRRSTLDALAAAGLYGVTAPVEVGGGGQPPSVGREVAEVLAGACGSTWFVWTQHAMALGTVLGGDNDALRERALPGLATGRTPAAVAFAHVRRPGPPAVTATREAGGWRFDGRVDWTTGWGLDDVLLLAGRSPDDAIVFVLLPATEAPGLTASPLPLAVMQGTCTVALALDGLHVADADVAQVVPAAGWLEADRYRTANASPHTLGLHREVVRRLAQTAERRGDGTASGLAVRLGEEGERVRSRAYALVDDVAPEERLQERLDLRAASLDLVVRAATALVTATGGSATSLANPAQRLAREALFHLVQAQTPPVREATLQRLGAGLETPRQA